MRILRLAVSLWMAGAIGASLYGQASVLTWHNDNARTGQNLLETALTPASVNASTFGRLFTIGVDGRVDAQPLYVPGLAIPSLGLHNVLYVVTEHDSVYAFDADTGAQLWHVSMLLTGEVPSDDRGCGQVTPEMGVTSTPAIDLQAGSHGTMYVVAMSKNGTTYHQRLHALDLTTGGEQFSGPMEVQATYAGSGDGSVNSLLTFDPKQYKERAGLLIFNGVVYTSWASHCDIFPYTAWVIGYNELTLSRVSVLNLTPNGSDGSVWAAGAGPAADANGNIFLLMANGTFDTTLDGNGFPNKQDYGNAFVKINTGGTVVGDYFTMFNTVSESNADADLGSGGAILLPPLNNAQGQPRDLAVGAGKDHHIYVVDRANMGKFNMTSNAIYQDLPSSLANSVFSTPAWFNGTLYYGAVSDTLKAFGFANGLFGATPTSHTASNLPFPYPGTTPSISANGAANGIVWAAENANPAVLHAYDATNLATELYNSNMAANSRDHFGAGNKFIVPTVVNGKVYVGTTNGVGVFGVFCGCTILPTGVSYTAAGGSGTVNVTTQTGCSWTATSNAGFLSITSGPGGTGNGVVSYTVTANSGATRSGTLTIAGQTFTVTQTGTGTGFAVAQEAIFRNGLWVIDLNGNFQWDNAPPDSVIGLGQQGDVPVVGDWNGDGHAKAGVFRNGQWVLDYNGNGVWDGLNVDRAFNLGQAGDIAVVGDWNGDGRAKAGIFRNGLWVLDYNGNGVWDGLNVDRAFNLGQAGDIPVVGDWNGDGRAKAGIFRNGLWVLDYNGNGIWDGLAIDRAFNLGQAGDTPLVGDWNGDGRAKVAIFRNGLWVFDYNGNGQWDGPQVDRSMSLGQAGDVPVVGDWNGSGTAKGAIFRNGLWVFDYNGNFVYDGTVTDRISSLGTTGDKPVPARW